MPSPVVLVVEDQMDIRELLSENLLAAGFGVEEAQNGEEGMAALYAGNLSAIVTDINLGRGPSGWEVARRARELMANVAVVYVTADAVAEWNANGVPQSVIVAKPFAPAQVVTAVAALLNHSG